MEVRSQYPEMSPAWMDLQLWRRRTDSGIEMMLKKRHTGSKVSQGGIQSSGKFQ
jgi:hypothetical protein